METLHYFKKNVRYPIGIRYFIGDNKGKTLTEEDPYVAVEAEDLRDFKRANKIFLEQGILLTTNAPDLDEDSPNAITEDKMVELLKNVFILKKTLPSVTSESMLFKLLEIAKENNRSKRTLDLISKRLEEVSGVSKADMQGIEDGKVYRSGLGDSDTKAMIKART